MPTTTKGLTVRIVLAEDHLLVREGLKSILAAHPAFQIVGEASDGLGAVQLVETLKPDVLILDLRIPRLHGLEVLRQLRGQTFTKVIVVTMYDDDPSLIEALRNGAAGYVLKDCAGAELFEAIRSVQSGEQYLAEALRQKATSAALKRLVPGVHEPRISPRELVVMQLAAEGRTSAEIASHLFISRRTAEAHRANVLKKLHLKNQTDLVLYAVRNGMLSP